MELLSIFVLMAPLAILWAVSRNRREQRRLRAATLELRVDEFGVRRELADGRQEELDWGELREVDIVRTDRGPHGKSGGMVVLYGDATRGCIVPLDRAEDSGLYEALSRLPGFDARKLAKALDTMGTHEIWVHATGGYEPEEADPADSGS